MARSRISEGKSIIRFIVWRKKSSQESIILENNRIKRLIISSRNLFLRSFCVLLETKRLTFLYCNLCVDSGAGSVRRAAVLWSDDRDDNTTNHKISSEQLIMSGSAEPSYLFYVWTETREYFAFTRSNCFCPSWLDHLMI